MLPYSVSQTMLSWSILPQFTLCYVWEWSVFGRLSMGREGTTVCAYGLGCQSLPGLSAGAKLEKMFSPLQEKLLMGNPGS